MQTTRRWLLALILGGLLGPLIFSAIQGAGAFFDVPIILALGAKTKVATWSVLAAVDIVASIITSAVLCVPLAYFAKQNPMLLGAGIGIITSTLILYLVYSEAETTSSFLYALSAIEHVAFVCGCIGFATIGAKWERHMSGRGHR